MIYQKYSPGSNLSPLATPRPPPRREPRLSTIVTRQHADPKPESETQSPKPEARSSKPENRNPKTETRNSKSETRNPNPNPKPRYREPKSRDAPSTRSLSEKCTMVLGFRRRRLHPTLCSLHRDNSSCGLRLWDLRRAGIDFEGGPETRTSTHVFGTELIYNILGFLGCVRGASRPISGFRL